MKEYNMISGGVDMSYQTTLILQLAKRLTRKAKRKNKIKIELDENQKNPEKIATNKGQNIQNLEKINLTSNTINNINKFSKSNLVYQSNKVSNFTDEVTLQNISSLNVNSLNNLSKIEQSLTQISQIKNIQKRITLLKVELIKVTQLKLLLNMDLKIFIV